MVHFYFIFDVVKGTYSNFHSNYPRNSYFPSTYPLVRNIISHNFIVQQTNENQYVQNFELDTRYSRLTYLNDGKSVPIDYIFRIKAGLYHLTRCHPQDVADGGIILKPDHPLADSSKIFEFSLEQVRILTMDLNLMAFRILIVEDHWLVNCGFTSDSMALIFYTSVSKSIAQQPTVVDYVRHYFSSYTHS